MKSRTSNDAEVAFENRLVKALVADASPADMTYVASCFLHGHGTTRDIAASIDWLTKAATLGDPEAQIRLSELYELGEVVLRDCDKARYWCDQAELSGGFWPFYARAVAHYFGSDCVPVDLDQAYVNFARAAKKGHLVSEFQLARLLRTGRYGLVGRLRGYLISCKAFALTCWIILRQRDSDNRLWDAQRWLEASNFINRIRRGTRFE